MAKRGPITHGCAKYSTPGMPIRTTGSEKNASSEATMRSQTQASISPPAMQAPCTIAIGRLRDLPPAAAHAEVHLGLAGEALVAAGLAHVVPPHHGRVEGRDVAAGGADVVAGGEVLAVAGQDDDLDLVVVDGAVERGVQRVGHGGVLGVAVLGPVHRHDRDAVAHLVGDDICFP